MWLDLIILVFLYIYGTYGTNFYKYNILQGSPNDDAVRCIARSLNVQHEALRIRDWDGECTILTLSWISNKIFYAGYTYVEKQQTVISESFSSEKTFGVINLEDPENERIWTLPRPLQKGGSILISVAISPQDEWSSFQFRLSTLAVGSPFRFENNTINGYLLFSITFNRVKDEVRFKTYGETGWTTQPSLTPFPFVNERSYLIDIVAANDGLQILFDGVEQTVLPYVCPPEEGKSFIFRHNVNKALPVVDNITLT